MFTKKFLLDTAERVVRTFAQGLAAQGFAGNAAVFSMTGFKFGLAAAVAALVMALAGKPFGPDKESGSVVG